MWCTPRPCPISGVRAKLTSPVGWPPRSCDLTPLDYFLWGYVKATVYANKPATIDELRTNIKREIAAVSANLCLKIIKNVRFDLAIFFYLNYSEMLLAANVLVRQTSL